jgi:CheY-like chemotaxis protein
MQKPETTESNEIAPQRRELEMQTNRNSEGLAGKKILVIDDEPDVVTYFTTILEDHGMTTCRAANGAEGMAAARTAKPDLITLDIAMPEQAGVKTLRQLQEDPALAHIPVVIITGVSQELKIFLRKTRQVRPPSGYLSKPITEHDLIDTLTEILVAPTVATGRV